MHLAHWTDCAALHQFELLQCISARRPRSDMQWAGGLKRNALAHLAPLDREIEHDAFADEGPALALALDPIAIGQPIR